MGIKRKGASRIGSVLTDNNTFDKIGIAARLREFRVLNAWKRAVGKQVAVKASPTRFIKDTLYCSAVSSAWMTELRYQKASIIARINEAVGEEAVREIVFKAGDVTTEPETVHSAPRPSRRLTEEERKHIDETVGPVKDDALKNLIKRVMGKSIAEED